MNSPMMQPGRWATGVQQPSYTAPLLDFSPLGQAAGNVAGQLKGAQAKPGAGQPMQLTPGPNQAKPMQPQGQPGGFGGGMNAMASTANAAPWASALMQMFGGAGMAPQPGSFNIGTPGGTNPFGGSSTALY